MKSKVFPTATAITAVLVLVACSNGGNQVAPVSFDSVVSIDATTTTSPPSTTAIATTVAPTTVAPTLDPTTTGMSPTQGLTGPMFSDALGIKVATAPGIHTAGDTRQLLPEGLYVHLAWESDPNDLSVFSPIPEDIPILEAYANAAGAFYLTATTDLRVKTPDFEPFMLDSGAQFEASLSEASAGGYVDSLGSGVTLRPYVLADHRTDNTAIVLDCTLSDEQFILRHGGRAELRVQQPRGQIASMVRVGSNWKVDVFAEEPAACL